MTLEVFRRDIWIDACLARRFLFCFVLHLANIVEKNGFENRPRGVCHLKGGCYAVRCQSGRKWKKRFDFIFFVLFLQQ